MPQRLIPVGECWCGYCEETEHGFFFLSDCGKIAESAVLLIEYGGVPEFLATYGYAIEGIILAKP